MNRGVSDGRLNRLMQYASSSVPFYEGVGSNSIVDFPVVDKSIIKKGGGVFLSDKFDTRKLYKTTTSGSTGTPFSVYQDRNKRNRNYADTIYFANRAGYDLGDTLWYFKIWATDKMSPNWVYSLRNMRPVDVLNLTDHVMDEVAEGIGGRRPRRHSVLGYVSALERLIKYCERKGKSFSDRDIGSVITMSEYLSEETRIKLKDLFGCDAVARYSNLENGIIAQQELGGDRRYLVNTASYYVEVLGVGNDMPVDDGEVGRIVVTDYFNYAMPMIRYDTGDMGSIVRDDGRVYLDSIEGRKLDVIYNTNQETVSSYLVYRNMWKYEEIDQFQIVQDDVGVYTIKINCPSTFRREKEMVGEFLEYLGSDAVVRVEYVDGIPLLASGKRRMIVNNMHKST